jgi:hypothetical protein
MKYLIPILLLFPSLVFAVDDAAVQANDSKASMAKSIAGHNDNRTHGNNSRIQALEADICVLFETLNTQYSIGLVVPDYCAEPDAEPGIYEIGDFGPAGGIVFYVTDGGLHGLEAAPVDQAATAPWGCIFTEIVGAEGITIGTGAQNTADILAPAPSGCNTRPIAASVAADYAGPDGNSLGEWFLPSKDELNELYLQRAIVGDFTAIDGYWSSTEESPPSAWVQSFQNGNQFNLGKNESTVTGTRAVRAF